MFLVSSLAQIYLVMFCLMPVTLLFWPPSTLATTANENTDAYVDTVSDDDGKNEPFQPTHEWQTINPGQAIPAGLHVQMDMTTGERRAKLMPTEHGHTPVGSSLIMTQQPEEETQGEPVIEDGKDRRKHAKQKLDHAELKRAMKRLSRKDLGDLSDDAKKPATSDEFRSYAALQSDLDDMGVKVKSDSAIIRDHLTEYGTADVTDARRLDILEDLEYYVHQIDNADNFVKMKGMSVIKTALNHSNPEFRWRACYLLGSAVQSNPGVQAAALADGVLHQLIHTLPAEATPSVRKKAIYALSALLRHCPEAQQQFVHLGGIGVISDVFKRVEFPDHQVRIVTLMHDLILEKHALLQEAEHSEVPLEQDVYLSRKLQQYDSVDFLSTFLANGWCPVLPALLERGALPEGYLDGQEKVLSAMSFLSASCQQDFTASRHILRRLKADYETRLSDDSANDYVESLLTMVTTLLDATTADAPRHEL